MVCRSYFVAAAILTLVAGPACAGEAMLGVYQHAILDGISHGDHLEHGKEIVGGCYGSTDRGKADGHHVGRLVQQVFVCLVLGGGLVIHQ